MAGTIGIASVMAVAVCIFGVAPTGAQEVPDNVAVGRILEGWRTPQGTQMAAVEIDLLPGWKTYWRSPGEAGIPPHFDWRGSGNLAGVVYHWPSPEVFETSGTRTIGYHGRLVLPVELSPLQADQPIDADATVDFGVCDEICVPVTLSLKATLPVRTTEDPVILSALADGPTRARMPARQRCAAPPTRFATG